MQWVFPAPALHPASEDSSFTAHLHRGGLQTERLAFSVPKLAALPVQLGFRPERWPCFMLTISAMLMNKVLVISTPTIRFFRIYLLLIPFNLVGGTGFNVGEKRAGRRRTDGDTEFKY